MITRDESAAFIKRLTENPDTEMANVSTYLEQLSEVYDSYEAMATGISERDEKIRQLQDTNMRLFLAQIGAPAEPDEDREITLEEFATKM